MASRSHQKCLSNSYKQAEFRCVAATVYAEVRAVVGLAIPLAHTHTRNMQQALIVRYNFTQQFGQYTHAHIYSHTNIDIVGVESSLLRILQHVLPAAADLHHQCIVNTQRLGRILINTDRSHSNCINAKIASFTAKHPYINISTHIQALTQQVKS